MVSVACVGLATLDLVFGVSSLPQVAKKFYATRLTSVCGGPAANAAITMARLGGTARFIGCLGDDRAGRQIADDLESAGVNLEHVKTVRGATSSTSAVIVDAAGERLILNFSDPRLLLDLANSDPAFDDCQAVLSDSKWLTAAHEALLAAKKAGIPGVLDYDSTSSAIQDRSDVDALAMASHIIFSAPALMERTGTRDVVQGLNQVAGETEAWLAVTLGGEGVIWLNDMDAQHLPAFEVSVIETLGAGDVFHGAFTLELARGKSETEAVNTASAASAIRCTRVGGPDAIPTSIELQFFMEKNASKELHVTTVKEYKPRNGPLSH